MAMVPNVLKAWFPVTDWTVIVCVDGSLPIEETIGDGVRKPVVLVGEVLICVLAVLVEYPLLLRIISFHCLGEGAVEYGVCETARQNCNSFSISSSSSPGMTVRDGGVSLKPTSCRFVHLHAMADCKAW
jgi:hypothetical protein